MDTGKNVCVRTVRAGVAIKRATVRTGGKNHPGAFLFPWWWGLKKAVAVMVTECGGSVSSKGVSSHMQVWRLERTGIYRDRVAVVARREGQGEEGGRRRRCFGRGNGGWRAGTAGRGGERARTSWQPHELRGKRGGSGRLVVRSPVVPEPQWC